MKKTWIDITLLAGAILLMCVRANAQQSSSGYLPDDSAWITTLPVMQLTPQSAALTLPSEVDNSALKYFPHEANGEAKMYNQQESGSCQSASLVYYTFGYEFNRLNNTAANIDANWYAPNTAFNHINSGLLSGSGTCSSQSVFHILEETGVANAADWGNLDAEDFRRWLNGYDKWNNRLYKRIVGEPTIIKIIPENGDGINLVKHYLFDHNAGEPTGGVLSVGVNFWGPLPVQLPQQSAYSNQLVKISYTGQGGHQVTVVGYCDNIKYDINGDGQFTNNIDITGDGIIDLRDWEIGAFKIANSYGSGDGNGGFTWALYRCFYISNVFYTLQPINYSPEVVVKAKINQWHRNDLEVGVAWGLYANSNVPPAFSNVKIYDFLNRDGGPFPLKGDKYPDPAIDYASIELMLDYSYFFKDKDFGQISLFTRTLYPTIDDKVIDFSLVDYRWNEEFELNCDEKNKPIDGNWSANSFMTIEYDLIPHEAPITQNLAFNSNMVSRFNPSVSNNANLSVGNNVRIDMYSSTITIDAGSSLLLGDNVVILAKRGNNKLIIKGDLLTGQNVTFEAIDGADLDVIYENTEIPGTFNGINCNFKNASLVIQSGVLSINNSTLKFSSTSKIIVKQQTKLKLDASQLTNYDSQQWRGIEVWGSTYQNQFSPNGICAQGSIEIGNYTVIENAYNGITNWKPDDWNSIGGIIKADGATFKNCRRGVEFMKYRNFHPTSGYEMDNVSYFNNCSFIVDDNYPANASPFYTGVSLWSVRGVKFSGCDFFNNKTVKGSGYGIFSLDAGYKISAICSSQASPCPEQYLDKTWFRGFEYGINASNAETSNTVNVQDSKFTDNGYGIELRNVNNTVVLKSRFEMASATNCPNYGYGLNLVNCTGYAIEENTFTVNGVPPANSWSGIKITNSGTAYNEIYKNTFQNLTTGNLADLLNASTNTLPPTGLTYLCNTNTNNDYDFYVTNKPESRISYYQRSGTATAAGNSFSQGTIVNFHNGGGTQIRYYYSTGGAPPTYYGVVPVYTANANTCPSHYGGGSGNLAQLNQSQMDALEAQYAGNYSAYNNVKSIYETLKDGGSTTNTVEDIETSMPSEMWELRAKLLGDSPHLSQTALKEAALKTDVLPESVLFEILSANPDEMRDESFLSFLESKENPLPVYMIDLLRAIAGNTSYKTVLQEQLNAYNTQKTLAASDIIRSKLNDSIVSQTDIINWFDNRGDLYSRYQMVDAYLQTGNYTAAQAMLTLIPGLHELSMSDLADYQKICELKNLQINILSAGRNLAMLTNTEKEQLSVIADANTGIASTQAKGILEFMTGTPYCNCVRYNDELKHGTVKPSKVTNLPSEIKISVAPNPATTWITFEYSLPEKLNSATVIITDNTGRRIETLTLTGKQGQKVLDTRKYASGAYIYQCNQDKKVSGKFIIK